MTTIVLRDLSICQDCLMIIANDDDSGIEDGEAHRARMDDNAFDGEVVLGGEDLGFSHTRCDCCGDHLHGDRYTAFLLGEAV